MQLACTNPAVRCPQSVTVPAGATSLTFKLGTNPVTSPAKGVVTATLGSVSFSQPITVVPTGVKSVSLSPNPAVGGTSVTGTVTLQRAAPADDITVTLTSSNPKVANPTTSTITIPAGSTTRQFTVQTATVTANYSPRITGAANGTSSGARLYLTP